MLVVLLIPSALAVDLGDLQVPADRIPFFDPGVEGGIPDTSTWPVVNALDYGATPNDGTDDSSAIDAAIDAAASLGTPAVVLLPEGTYNTLQPTKIHLKSNVVLKGEGPGKTFIYSSQGSGPSDVITIAGEEKYELFTGAISTEDGRTTFTVEGFNFETFYPGYSLEPGSRVYVRGSHGLDCDGDGVEETHYGACANEVVHNVEGNKLTLTEDIILDPSITSISFWVYPSYKPIGGFNEGSNTLTLSQPPFFEEGVYILISQDNDERIHPNAWFARGLGQVVKVVGINGNNVQIHPALRIDFNPDYNLKITKPDFIYNSGVEDLSIEVESVSPVPLYRGDPIKFTYVINSWVKNIYARNAYQNFVSISDSARLTIRDNHFKTVQKPDYTNTYAISFGRKASDCLVTNNILEDVWVTAIFSGSANGNVYSYNYHKDIREDHGIIHHGTYPFENLIEGNDAYRLTHDCWWGKQGPRITYFRNRAGEIRTSMNGACEAEGVVADQLNTIGNTANYYLSFPWCSYPNCFDYDRMNTNMWVEKNRYRINFIGVDTPDSTNTFIDNVQGDVPPAEWADFDMPASLYLESPPSFWCEELPWPAIGSDVDDYANLNMLPAQRRYEGLQCTPVGDIPDCIYVVDKDSIGGICNDANPGTLTEPWCSLGKAAQTVQQGEKVCVRAGTYIETLQPQTSGTYYGKITFVAYEGGNVEIDGINLDAVDYVRIEDLKFREISQWGITWTFDNYYDVGTFINDDFWVVGPATIIAIDPNPANGRHGSVLNLPPELSRSGFDSRVVEGRYDPSLRVYPSISMQPGDSLVSTISVETVGEATAILRPMEYTISPVKTASVLTCLATKAPQDAFRPSYCDTSNTLYLERNLQRGLLPTLPQVPNTEELSEFEGYFRRPWIDTLQFNFDHPVEYMAHYGRENARAASMASLLLMLDFTEEEKDRLLMYLIQYGIDLYGIVEAGHPGWPALGGHGNGRKWPIVFAGIMLGEDEIARVSAYHPSTKFGDDMQTGYDQCWTGANVVFLGMDGIDENPNHPEWAPYEHLEPIDWPGAPLYRSEGYRRCCTSSAWVGQAVGAQLMNAEDEWDHPAFFDYVNRWMTEDDSEFVDIIQEQIGMDYHVSWMRQGQAFGDTFVEEMFWEYWEGPVEECTTNGECEDGQFCTGAETCQMGSCVSSGNPCDTSSFCNPEICVEDTDSCVPGSRCDDSEMCTIDNCNAGLQICTHSINTAQAGCENYLFIDNFEDQEASDWTSIGSGSWSIVSDSGSYAYRLSGGVSNPGQEYLGAYIIVDGLNIVNDFALNAKIRSTSSHEWRDLAIIFGYQDDTHYYAVIFNAQNDPYTNGIFLINGAPKVKIGTPDAAGTLVDNSYHDVRIVRSGSNIDVYFDDMTTPVFTAVDSTFSSGSIGFGTMNDNGAIDDVRVSGVGVMCTNNSDCTDASSCTGDVCEYGSCRYINYNLDGSDTVGLGDIIQIITYWGLNEGEPGWDPSVDLDENGNIGLSDIIVLLGIWGVYC